MSSFLVSCRVTDDYLPGFAVMLLLVSLHMFLLSPFCAVVTFSSLFRVCCILHAGMLVLTDRLCGQRSWLQIEEWVRFPALPDFLGSSGSGTGSTQPREDN
jgi:hypothetical protein